MKMSSAMAVGPLLEKRVKVLNKMSLVESVINNFVEKVQFDFYDDPRTKGSVDSIVLDDLQGDEFNAVLETMRSSLESELKFIDKSIEELK